MIADRPVDVALLESGIILPVPDAEAAVGDLRRRHDPVAQRGVPAHITLLYPFAHPAQAGEETGRLLEFFGAVARFEFLLTEVRRFPGVVYLCPTPSDAFVEITNRLVRQWPEFPPYGGRFREVIPHLTVADGATPDVLDAVERRLAASLPIRCVATEAWLIVSDEHKAWSRHQALPLAASHAAASFSPRRLSPSC